MGLNQIINMVIRMVMRKAINGGINAGMRQFGNNKNARANRPPEPNAHRSENTREARHDQPPRDY